MGLIDLGGDWEVTFDGFGIPDSGGFVDVQSNDVHFRVVVNPDTGAAEVVQ